MCSRRKMETSCKTDFMSGQIKELRKKEMSKKSNYSPPNFMKIVK